MQQAEQTSSSWQCLSVEQTGPFRALCCTVTLDAHLQVRFDSGKRAFAVNTGSNTLINFPQTEVNVGGGQPLTVTR